jgi:hypothetical protein
VKVAKRKGWTRAHRQAYRKTMALKKLSRSGIVHTPLTGREVKPVSACPVPSEVRDIDSIFGRLSRLSEAGRDFVYMQIFKVRDIDSIFGRLSRPGQHRG